MNQYVDFNKKYIISFKMYYLTPKYTCFNQNYKTNWPETLLMLDKI